MSQILFKLGVDRFLDDGRLVVVNYSDCDIPLKNVVTEIFKVVSAGDINKPNYEYDSVATVNLSIDGADIFRKVIEFIPQGYCSAIELSGVGIEQIASQLSAVKEKERIVLSGVLHSNANT